MTRFILSIKCSRKFLQFVHGRYSTLIGCQPGAGKPRPFFYAGFAVITGARDDSIAGLLSMPEPLENYGTVAMVFPAEMKKMAGTKSGGSTMDISADFSLAQNFLLFSLSPAKHPRRISKHHHLEARDQPYFAANNFS